MGAEKQINIKQVALTFDDGPAYTTTPQVLDILEEHGVVATFFLVGKVIEDITKDILKRQIAMGCELANHSYSHGYLNQMTAAEIRREIEQTSAAIREVAGVEPQFFRPPYIAVNDLMYDTIELPFIQGIMADDWLPEVSPRERTRRILDHVQDGTIILLHDTEGNEGTVAALPDILDGLKQKGYQLVTLSQLFKNKGVDPNRKNHIWTHII
ncbi:MAG: polysaccharide deacetylase family protein [Lachnospiraceae bacterium]|nr:polysaccharide deacetylase family protein [Lachnospiraceae bacterium]